MSLSDNEVSKIAHLARIAIEDDKIHEYAQDLSNILDLVEQMKQANTDDVEPMSNPMDATQRLRNDEVTAINEREKFQSIAPATEDGLYLVPQVIE